MNSAFGTATAAWFEQSFERATPVQERGWASIASGQHTLLCAPTGSGKTLAAFLWCLDRLVHTPNPTSGYSVVYVSPIKALVYDIERNLRAPLLGLSRWARAQGWEPGAVSIDVRTGDTSARDRQRHLRRPGQILVTTPESLFLLVGSRARANLRTVSTVIVDEIHALAGTKRGAHLAVTLERLCALTDAEPQRIGLSATQRPLERVGQFLAGQRPVTVIDASAPPALDLTVEFVPPDDSQPPEGPARGRSLLSSPPTAPELPQSPEERGQWPAILRRVLELVRNHRTTLVFVNNRRSAERVAARLNELAGVEIALPHHGSVSHRRRLEVEEALKAGRVPCIVATSSLELGIDMGAIDLVVLVESPGAVSRGLQRVGRAGHSVGAVSEAVVLPKFAGDLVECAVVAGAMRQGAVETTRIPQNPLDVLAQQVAAIVADADCTVDEVERIVKRAHNFTALTRDALHAVLDMLSGRYPSVELAHLRPRLDWDRDTDTLTARRGTRAVLAANAGTIADRGAYPVHLGTGGPRIGELDEEMVYESRVGETFTLGASTWRILEIAKDRVLVEPAPGEPGKMPFWRGDAPGRPIELGRRLGAFLRELSELSPGPARVWLAAEHALDGEAATALLDYVAAQREATTVVPSDRTLLVERFRDALGDWRVCVLTPFGAQVHAPWAIAVQGALSRALGVQVRALWTDDGFALQLAGTEEAPELSALFPPAAEIEEAVVQELGHTALFASRFREAAGRALLLPRRRPGERKPLWLQRQRSAQLLGVARQLPSFPIVLETYRECLADFFDLGGVSEVLKEVDAGRIRVVSLETAQPSPFARSLAFSYVAAYLYETDAPAAERRAQALTLDRGLLAELLGHAELRDLLDLASIADVEAELQATAAGFRAASEEAMVDLLRRLGDLDVAELHERCEGPLAEWVERAVSRRQVVRVRVAGRAALASVHDVALLRDALGVAPPLGVPQALLGPTEPTEALESLVLRWARAHGPFSAARVEERFGLSPGELVPLLQRLERAGKLTSGAFLPGGAGLEYCEVDNLRRIRVRALARLRKEVAPVEPRVFAVFLARWQGLVAPRRGLDALRVALEQLEGQPLPLSELEGAILPARVADYAPRMLDELGMTGEVVWIGAGALGASDGRVVLLPRAHAARLGALSPAAYAPPTPQHAAVIACLEQRGACFLAELDARVGNAPERLVSVLLDLAWAGVVTNDTLQPLRVLPSWNKKGRGTMPPAKTSLGGRWALTRSLGDPLSDTAVALARSHALLQRYGVVSAPMAHAAGFAGGFAAVYPVLRSLEDVGKVRRGSFVADLDGAQFATPVAIEVLRAVRPDDAEALVLSVLDPANPWGSLFAWPPTARPGAPEPRRVAGAQLIVVGGKPCVYVDPSGKNLATFADLAEVERERAFQALPRVAERLRGPAHWSVERVDGEPALREPYAGWLQAVGFALTWRGLAMDAPLRSAR